MKVRFATILLVALTASTLAAGCSGGGSAALDKSQTEPPAPIESQAEPPAPADPTVTLKGTIESAEGWDLSGGMLVCLVGAKGGSGKPDITVNRKTLEFTSRDFEPLSSPVEPDGSFEVTTDSAFLEGLGKCTLVLVQDSPGDILVVWNVNKKKVPVQFEVTDAVESQIDLGKNLKQASKATMYYRK